MTKQVQTELLPPGWKVSHKLRSHPTESYHLNDEETLKKLKGHAERAPMTIVKKKDNSLSLQFSTGAYMEAVGPLVKFWRGAEGKGKINADDTDGLEVKVTNVKTKTEHGEKTVWTIVKLDVDDVEVTITCFDTQVSMRVQGGHKQFSERALIPYLEEEIKDHAKKIKDINTHFRNFKNEQGKTAAAGKENLAPKNRRTNFKLSKVVTEQQLEESDIDMSELEDSIISVESDKQEDLVELEEENQPSPIDKSNKVAVTPDETFCLENNLTLAPKAKALWVDLNLPKNWNAENNVLSGRSLPSADIAALLHAVHATSKPGEMTLEETTESIDKSVEPLEDSGGPEKESVEPTALLREPEVQALVQTEEGLGSTKELDAGESLQKDGQLDSARELEAEDTTQMEGQHGSAGGMAAQVPGSLGLADGLKGNQVPASGMEARGRLLLDPCRPTHDTSGDVLRFLSEMRKQSDRLADMEIRNKNMEQMIVSLQESFHKVASRLERHQSGAPAATGVARVPQEDHLPASSPPSRQATGGARARSPPRLPRARARSPPRLPRARARSPPRLPRARARSPPHLPRVPRPAVGQEDQAEVLELPMRIHAAGRSQGLDHSIRDTLKCNKCDHTATNERRMSNHVENIHTKAQQATAPLALLVGDSHLGSVNRREVEKVLGRGPRLIAPGAIRPREDRAYCSTPEWPGARYPQNSLQQMVPELLGERKYTSLIMMAPTNDITNLKQVRSKQEQEKLAIQSARNTIQVAVMALKSVEKVLILEQPIRLDEMAGLSEFSKLKLREFAKSCPQAGRIKIGSSRPDILNTEKKKTEVFGYPTAHKVDGIHMRGEKGKDFLTETIKEAVKFAGLADSDSRVGTGIQSSQRTEEQEQGWSRVERGPRSSPRLDGQERSWADVTTNTFYTLSN